MKKTNQETEITGRWKVYCFYVNHRREEDIIMMPSMNDCEDKFKVLPADGFEWDFSADGILTEKIKGKDKFRSEYSFSPEDNTLRIVRGNSKTKNPMHTRPEDIYHVVLCKDALVLIDIEKADPEDNVYRQIILHRPQ